MTPTRPKPCLAHAARAFSLVEVLIAVLVLSLGLLGLGAVFPMVMREQRISTETNLGISASNAVEQMLFSRPDFSRNGGPGWEAFREYLITNNGRSGDWIAVEPESSDQNHLNAYIFEHPDTGVFYHIPLAQRLYPVPYSTDQDPRFVWDMAARFTDEDNPDTSPILVAIFLRPIDPGIRTSIDPNDANNRPYSVVSTLIDSNVPARERRNPVSVDRMGRPTQDGRRDRGGVYAKPIVAEGVPGPGPGIGVSNPEKEIQLNRILDPSSMILRDAHNIFYRAGMTFVDANGIVRTIRSVTTEPLGGGSFKVTFVDDLTPQFTDFDDDDEIDGDDYNPILFLPQLSNVEPIVFTVDP